MLKVGLIGFGLAGQAFHAPVIRAVPGLELACILERSGNLAQQRYPGVRIARTLDELLADEQIRLIVVATPNTSHFDLTRRCLLAGRDVVVDKPFTNTSGEAAELIRLAEQQKRLLSVYQDRRFDGDFHTVRKIVASGVLGRLDAYESNYDRFRPERKGNAWRERPEPGGGILYDLGPHILDQAFTLFGEPSAITADVFFQRDGSQVDDGFDIRLEYPRMRVTLRSSIIALAPRVRFLIHGTRGSFVKNGMDPQEEPLRRGEAPPMLGSEASWGEDPEPNWGTLYLAEGESFSTRLVKTEKGDYREYYANVRDAILNGAPLAVTAREAARTIRAIELAFQSSKERRTIGWNFSI